MNNDSDTVEDQIPPEENQQDNNDSQRSAPSHRSLPRKNPLSQLKKPSIPGLSKGMGGTKQVLAAGARGAAAAATFLSSPVGWVTIGLLLLLLLLLFFLNVDESATNVTVTLRKTAPAQVANDENIAYALNVSYTGNPSSITVTDKIPDNTDYVTSGGPGSPTYNATTRTVTWTVPIAGGSGGTTGGGTLPPLGDNLPPTKDTCNGVYANISDGGQHDGDNYGDPGCTLATTSRVSYDFTDPRNGAKYHWDGVPKGLIDLLTQLDPQNVGYWIGISACEAPGFDPNNVTFFVGSTHTPDAGGAWGLFQMGSHGPYTPGNGQNGQYDRGDVNWQNQVYNAVHDNTDRVIPAGLPPFRYYQCASDVFGLW